MKTAKIKLYTLAELKADHPDAYARVHERWKGCQGDAWTEETMDSLRAVIDACGGDLKDWSIGAYAHSSLSVSVDDTYENENGDDVAKDSAWLLREVLTPNGYTKDGSAYFPGLCKWTGYCADDNFIEAVWKGMQEGRTLTEALEDLADVARQHFEDDLEQEMDEESMEANCSENLYTKSGKDDPT